MVGVGIKGQINKTLGFSTIGGSPIQTAIAQTNEAAKNDIIKPKELGLEPTNIIIDQGQMKLTPVESAASALHAIFILIAIYLGYRLLKKRKRK